jgi:hypothetical protein
MNLAMMKCPKWEKCSANICPLDPDWHQRTHGPGDVSCFYLVEAHKNGSEKRFELCGLREMYLAVRAATPAICARWAAIRRTVERAPETGSRLDRVAPGRS